MWKFLEGIILFLFNLIGFDPLKKINKLIKDNNIDIEINGNKKHDIKINHPRCLYKIALGDPELVVGETYMDKEWDSNDLEGTITAIYKSKVFSNLDNKTNFYKLFTKLFNMQNITRSKQVGTQHYDIGNDLYEAILDPNMQYSCGYWKNASSLEEAQNNKLDLLCRKLDLPDSDSNEPIRILDIGCGFGSLAKFISDKYKDKHIEITGLSISKEQIKYAENKFNANKESRITILFKDYRDFCNDKDNYKKFDRVISVGMFEHVGYKNYTTYFECAHNVLKDDGLFVLHTIGSGTSVTYANRWIDKYIFPNGMLPSVTQIGSAIEGKFIMEDWCNFGDYYADTLQVWLERSEKFFQTTTNPIYTERFQRMWKLYLVSSKVNFRTRNIHLWQLVLSPKGIKGVIERQS
ncbi:MAG: cyclopropane-fatty-acyl-phospholipid synthase [Terrestrivirus sp.]|uniref:Cyclopropane-fatty-acyl-phospholipid synthase n=1 Tax=Terrestrivirus sp. TaxID=2487775 RepID=A0A3G4ZNZ5_9VIRU|nr:MAG: cyclopropane-fatty-acyl-phospholipid synthase [Terrestrivirus sp.]